MSGERRGDVADVEPTQNPYKEWFGIARLPEGQTVNDVIREMRDEAPGPDPAREGGPGARIVYLRSGEPIPRD